MSIIMSINQNLTKFKYKLLIKAPRPDSQWLGRSAAENSADRAGRIPALRRPVI